MAFMKIALTVSTVLTAVRADFYVATDFVVVPGQCPVTPATCTSSVTTEAYGKPPASY